MRQRGHGWRVRCAQPAGLQHQEELDERHRGLDADARQVRADGTLPGRRRARAAVQSAEDRVEHDPQLRHREMYLRY